MCDLSDNAIAMLFISAAVTALAKFGAHCDDLLHSILVLLERLVVQW